MSELRRCSRSSRYVINPIESWWNARRRAESAAGRRIGPDHRAALDRRRAERDGRRLEAGPVVACPRRGLDAAWREHNAGAGEALARVEMGAEDSAGARGFDAAASLTRKPGRAIRPARPDRALRPAVGARRRLKVPWLLALPGARRAVRVPFRADRLRRRTTRSPTGTGSRTRTGSGSQNFREIARDARRAGRSGTRSSSPAASSWP